MAVLSGLKPEKVFEYFEALCSVPHGSGNTKQISDLCASFAKKMGLKYVRDELNNLVIYKPGSAGLENAEPIILQGHMDMVCAKTEDCSKDMAKEGLDLYIEGDYIRAMDTSLGGDDGIAVAMILAILEDNSLRHPPIEAVFTVDEEVGMDGAAGLDMSLLKGRRMLNLDSEAEGVFTVSCAGGLRTDCVVEASETEQVTDGFIMCRINIEGLMGGHSGVEIDKGRGNAIKLMARFLYKAYKEFDSLRLISIEGGKFDNVICNNCISRIILTTEDGVRFDGIIRKSAEEYKDEFAVSDPEIDLYYVFQDSKLDQGRTVFNRNDTLRFIRALFLVPQGIAAMSNDIKGLVQTSSNIGIVKTTDRGIRFSLSVRSSLESQKSALKDRIEAAVEGQGGTVSVRGDYPGWAYRKDSPVRDTLSRVYEKQTGKKPVITAIHAGLECGLFSKALEGFDCVSIGPELIDIHSVGEKLGISSVHRLYDLLVEFLSEC